MAKRFASSVFITEILIICINISATSDEKSNPLTAGNRRRIGVSKGSVKLYNTPDTGDCGFTQLKITCISRA